MVDNKDRGTEAMNTVDKIIEQFFSNANKFLPSGTAIKPITPDELRALLLEAVEAERKDAERWRLFRSKTRGLRGTLPKDFCFMFPTILPLGNVMKGSVAQHLDDAIDAAIAAEGK